VYAHGSIGHLLANALALLLVGPLVERRTTRLRFHAFVIGTGALAGITQVTLGGLLGPQTAAVLGLSGAVFGLGGYLLASNVVSATLFDRLRLSTRAQFALFGLAARPHRDDSGAGRRALIAHATGAFCGLVTGRAGFARRAVISLRACQTVSESSDERRRRRGASERKKTKRTCERTP